MWAWRLATRNHSTLLAVTSAAMPGPQPHLFSRNLGMIYPEPSAYICKSAVLTEDTKRYVLLQAILSAPRTFRNTNKVTPQQAYPPPPERSNYLVRPHDKIPLVTALGPSPALSSCGNDTGKHPLLRVSLGDPED